MLKRVIKDVPVFAVAALLVWSFVFPTSFAFAQDENQNNLGVNATESKDDQSDENTSSDPIDQNTSSDSNESDEKSNDPSIVNDPANSLVVNDGNITSKSKKSPAYAPNKAPAKASYGTVTFDKSAGNKPIETVSFTSASEVLGNRGLYSTGSSFTKRYFIGWCENKTYNPATSAIWFSTSTIGEIYPEGFEGNKTLYAIYVGALELGLVETQGTVDIVNNSDPQRIIPDSTLKESSGFGDVGDKSATFYYDQNQENNKAVIDASMMFNEWFAILTYQNPGNILVNSGTWTDGPKKGASYSHVDLHFSIDPRIQLANEIAFTFTSYNYKPLYILDSNYQILKGDLSDLVAPNEPSTTLTFNPGDNHDFILRTTIRHDGNKKNALIGTPDQVLKPMLLTSASDANFSISRDIAREIALGQAQPLQLNGYIDGVFKASFLKRDIPIINAGSVQLSFAGDKVSFMDDATTLANVLVVHGAAINTDDFTSQTMPKDPSKSGYVFKGWNTAHDGSGTLFTGNTLVTGSTVVYAMWDKEQPVPPSPDPDPAPKSDDKVVPVTTKGEEKAPTIIAETGDSVVTLIAVSIVVVVAFAVAVGAFVMRHRRSKN